MKRPLIPIPWFTRHGLAKRTRQIISVLTKYGWGWLITQVQAGITSRAQIAMPGEDQTHLIQAEHLRAALNDLGATFIKLGQALSTRPDLLPPEFISELGKLQDEVTAVSFERIEEVIRSELKKEISELYATFDTEPIASASIGQVYAATLKNGRKVVVKVRRPGVEAQIEQDLEILTNMAEWLNNHSGLGKFYDLPTLISEFSFRLRNELNYIKEGQNANIFQKNFHDDKGVHIPHIYWELTTTRVLTMERVYGIKINDIAAISNAGINLRMVAENSGRFTLRQLFEFGFFHADPHPGNFFVQPDGSLAVVDFGMVGRLNRILKDSLLNMIMAMATRDADLLVDELLEIGITRSAVNVRSLKIELEHVFESYASGSAQFLSASQVMREILTMAFRFGMQLPGEFTMLIRLSTINEGISMQLYPEFRMLDFATPYVLKFWREKRSPEKVIPDLARSALDGLELGLNLPRRISRLLRLAERGQIEVKLDLTGLQQFSTQMQKMTNRLAMAIILAAVIVALGIVIVIYHPSSWQAFGEYLFLFAFISSLGFGAWLLWSIWRSGKN